MISKWFSRLVYGLFFLLFLFVFLNMIPCQGGNAFFLLCASGVFLAFLFFFYPRLCRFAEGLSSRQFFSLAACFLGAFFLLCALFGWHMLTVPKTDWGTVYYSAVEIAQTGHVSTEVNQYTASYYFTKGPNSEYFVIYPNNLAVLTLLAAFYKVLSFFGVDLLSTAGIYAGVLFNVLFLTAGALGGFLFCQRAIGKGGALLYLLFSCLFSGFLLNSYRFYTDTLSLPFVTFSLYAVSFLKPEGSWKKQFLSIFLSGIILGLGILMKGSLAVLAVAFGMYFFLRLKKKGFLGTACLLLSLLLVNGAFGFYKSRCPFVDYSREEELSFPITHWIMMAFGGNGGYSQADFEYTASFPNREAKTKANFEEMERRLSSFSSPADFLSFELAKTEATWGDGKFAQENHLAWKEDKGPLYDWILSDGTFYPVFHLYSTTFLYGLYSLFLLSAFLGLFAKEGDWDTLFCIILTGVLLFFSMWETRSRYLLNMTPVFFLFAISGLEKVRTGRFPVFHPGKRRNSVIE